MVEMWTDGMLMIYALGAAAAICAVRWRGMR